MFLVRYFQFFVLIVLSFAFFLCPIVGFADDKDDKAQEVIENRIGQKYKFSPPREITLEEWQKAKIFLDRAQLLRGERKYAEALKSIDQALEIVKEASSWDPQKRIYLDEKRRIDNLINRQTEIETGLNFNGQLALSQKNAKSWSGKIYAKFPGAGRYAGEMVQIKIGGVACPFHWCPPGTFQMGSPGSEGGHEDDEFQHTVTVTQGFWLLETEVTQKIWYGVTQTNPSFFSKGFIVDTSEWPVDQVSWTDCQKFIKKLNDLNVAPQGWRFELPTEAQWEYACRAGAEEETYVGGLEILGANNSPELDAIAWYGGNSSAGYEMGGFPTAGWVERAKDGAFAGSHPVRSKATPNAWGFYDMLGNVQEWCLDKYVKDFYQRSPKNDPIGSPGSERVRRGGSWADVATFNRAAHRCSAKPSARENCNGFRLALILDNSVGKTDEKRSASQTSR